VRVKREEKVMANLNRVTLIGRLGHDPDLSYTTRGTAVASFTLATCDKTWDKASGNLEDKTEWHNIVILDKLAVVAEKNLSRGRTIYVEGRLQTVRWEDKAGVRRNMTEIVADRLQILDGRPSAKVEELPEDEV
jgi:single-strand DNA-binding protein